MNAPRDVEGRAGHAPTASHHVTYAGFTVEVRPQETVLDALLRQGAPIPFSCRGGSCHTCLSRCVDGAVPPVAQRSLPAYLQELGYFLPCRCVPESDMRLERRRQGDIRTRCVLTAIEDVDTPFVRIQFEPATTLSYLPGQRLLLLGPDGTESSALLTSDPVEDPFVACTLHLPEGEARPAWLAAADFGTEFDVRGPMDADDARTGSLAAAPERAAPHPDAALWHELGEGAVVRRVLEDFYAQVYADAVLSPYFAGVTRERSIDKQYAFMRQVMTGQRADFVEGPRNAHHWMVIPPAVLDHRQDLMIRTLRAHGLSAAQVARWTRFEEHYRRDIVKSEPWPKRMGDQLIYLESFEWEVLGVASMCDYCEAEIDAGVRVRYHRRLGHISCPSCSGPPSPPGGPPPPRP